MSLSDEELFLRFKKRNDLEAFEVLVMRYQKPLVNLFFRLVGNLSTAENLAQEGFLNLIKGCKNYEPKAKFTTFLYRIAQNIWFDHIRIENKKPWEISLDKPVKEEEGSCIKDFVEGDSPAPYDKSVKLEQSELLKKAINKLPDDQKLTLELVIFQQLSYAEAAGIMDVPIGTVRSRLNTAISKLKTRLIKD
ncbi:MAG: sigma-70 family RNA polymerase sigma factor [Planctomycetota bacterium]